MVERLGIPVVTCWDSIDAIEDSHSLYVGRGGIMGDRAGNFAVQNADVILAIGNRLSIRQVGYNWKTWAREAYVIMVDVDPAELQKTTIHVELPIHADAGAFCAEMNRQLLERQSAPRISPLADCGEWVRQCQEWKVNYPVTLPKHWEEDGTYANVYAFIRYLSDSLPDGSRTVVSNGSACVVGSHNYVIKKDARFLINSGIASMGYGLPAAVGACIASGRQPVICIEGDGSLMMNLQELQTVITNRLPIRMFVINNEGYHSIRQTQNNMFAGRDKVGIGPESGDLGFPKFALVARAFGWEYMSASSNAGMKQMVDRALQTDGPVFCEVFVSPAQNFEPKSSTKRLADGTLVSPPLEDLAPFLPREELLRQMYIGMPE
jgi:acetolactate synthase-1/2/3 large subunit